MTFGSARKASAGISNASGFPMSRRVLATGRGADAATRFGMVGATGAPDGLERNGWTRAAGAMPSAGWIG